MKVWLVMSNDGEHQWVVGVFASEEGATAQKEFSELEAKTEGWSDYFSILPADVYD